MVKDHWSEIYTGPSIVTGNAAKVKVLHQLHALLVNRSTLAILDVGCVGPKPLEFWEPLLTHYGSRFHLTGIDVQGIAKAQEIAAQHGWKDGVTFQQGDGYHLRDLFAPQAFDVVIATQVLEHVAQLSRFMHQVGTVLKPGGEGFFTIDSAHWQARFDPCNPLQFVKNLIKKGGSWLGNERHYDLPWFDHEVALASEQAGLEVVAQRYYNLAPLKFIHNHIIPSRDKNTFMHLWFELEEFLNEKKVVPEKVKHLFMGLYFHVSKV